MAGRAKHLIEVLTYNDTPRTAYCVRGSFGFGFGAKLKNLRANTQRFFGT
jgi:hypothetical protein